tara:strand:+ start:298 stop:567 length:270 start_codon:yes stop_codon:yes gene_type:complete
VVVNGVVDVGVDVVGVDVVGVDVVVGVVGVGVGDDTAIALCSRAVSKLSERGVSAEAGVVVVFVSLEEKDGGEIVLLLILYLQIGQRWS